MAKAKSAATIKVQSQTKPSVVGGSATAKLSAAQKQAAIEAAAGIQAKVSPTLKTAATKEAAAAKAAESPITKPNVITRSGNTVFQNGKLVANYNDSAAADAAVASMQTATGKGAIIGDSAGKTYRSIYKPNRAPVGSPYSSKSARPELSQDTTTDTGSLTTPSVVTGDTSTDANGIYRPIIDSTPSAYGQKFGATTSSDVAIDSGYLTEKPAAARSLQDIRQEELAQAQAQIDATAALFNSEMQRLTQQGDAALSQTSAYAVGAGLAGSPFQSSLENKQKAENTQQYQALQAQRAADIVAVLDKAETNAQTIYQRGIENYRADVNTYIDERDKAKAAADADAKAKKDAAVSTLTTIAKSGYSIDELPKEQYQQLLTNSGMSDFEARATWAAASPEANATYTTQNGFIVGTYFDPHTGKPVVTTTPLPAELTDAVAPDIQNVSLADGSVVFYDAKNPYNVDGSLKTINYKGSDITDATVEDVAAPEIQKINGIDYQWDATTNSWVPAQVEGQTATNEVLVNNLQSKLDLIDSIANSAGKRGSVGAYGVSRWTPFSADKSAKADFFAGVQQLVSQDTLDQLIELKAAGGTLGALSEKELAMLQGAASKINTWILKDENGNPTGKIGISEKMFDAELAKIREATASALERAKGGSGDEIDNFLDNLDDPSFSSVGGDTNKAAVSKLATVAQPGTKGGQCGRFVNNYTGLGMGDSLASKLAKTDPSIKVGQPGDVFVSQYSWTGHTGFIESVKPRTDGTYDYTVLDSNYGLDEKVRRHVINSSKIVGYARVPLNV